jgi:hypothetical protein
MGRVWRIDGPYPYKFRLGGAMMPSHVRIFFWLVIAFVMIGMLPSLVPFTYPHPNIAASITTGNISVTHATDQMRAIAVFATVFWSGLILLLAFFAAFRRANWARWGIVLIFLIQQIVPLGTMAYFHHFGQYVRMHSASWPTAIAIPALLLLAIIFAFTGNARDWFSTAQP